MHTVYLPTSCREWNFAHIVIRYIQASKMTIHERYCSLTLDETSIKSRQEYDQSTGRILGSVNLPGHAGIATKALVVMICGITSRWKQLLGGLLVCFKIILSMCMCRAC